MAQVRLTLFGGFAARRLDGAAVTLPTRKAEALLALLACRPGEAQLRERLTALLWGERGDQQARHSLSQTLTSIRRALNGAAAALAAEREAIALCPKTVATDVAEFQLLAASDSIADLQAAAALYRGPLLEGLKLREPAFEEWLGQERARLHELAITVLLNLAERQTRLDDPGAAATLNRTLALDPLAEEVHRRLIRLHLERGAYNAAIRHYRVCVDILKRELGTVPEPSTTALYREALSELARAPKANLERHGPEGIDSNQIEGVPASAQMESQPGDLVSVAVAQPAPARERPESVLQRPAVAILPFANLSGDQGQEYFADGITEDLITALSAWRWFPVIARNSTFAYKGRSVDVTQVGRELGVRYVLEGSVQRAGERVRITAQLIDAATALHLWAQTYERRLGDMFELQDEITRAIIGAIEPQLTRAEQQRAARKHPENLDAWDLSLQALAQIRTGGKAALATADQLLGRAVAMEATSSYAQSLLALTRFQSALAGWTADPAGSFASTYEAAEAAVALDDGDWLAHALLGIALLWNRRAYDRALEEEAMAVALNPSAAIAYHFLGCVLTFCSRPAEAIPKLEAVLRLDPRFPFRPVTLADIGLAYLLEGELDEAVRFCEKAIGEQPENGRAWQRLAAALGHLGQRDAAATALAQVFKLQPGFGPDYLAATYPFRDPAHAERLLAGLRKAGLPAEARGVSPAAPATDLPRRPAIAVLPFVNMSGDPDQEYFADGLTEDIITDLSRLSALFVVARNTVFTFKGKAVQVQEAARALAADYILEGSVRRVDDRVRITAQLIDGRTGGHLWADRYDRCLDDIFALQDEIACSIAETLEVKLRPEELARIASRTTTKAEAYRYYLMGRSFFLRSGWGQRALRVARQMFVRASEIDPDYACAHAGIANCDSYLLCMGDPGVSFEDILASSARALDLEPQLAEAHAAKGLALYTAGRHAEANAALDEAVRLGPDSFEAHFFAARNCRAQGRYAEAATLFERAAALQPDDFRALGLAVNAYRSLGRHDEMRSAARRCLERVEAEIAVHPDNASALAFGAAMLTMVGEKAQAEIWADWAAGIEPLDSITNYNLACAYAALGKPDAAMARLHQVFSDPPASRRSHVEWMKHDSSFEPLRGHPEFEELLRRLEAETRPLGLGSARGASIASPIGQRR